MSSNKKVILIIGIEGFVGKNLTSKFESCNYDIYGTSLTKESEKVFRCDIRNKNDLIRVFKKIKPNYIFHLAGVSSPAHSKKKEIYEINTLGVINLMEAILAAELNPEKILISSSASVYGNQTKGVYDETLTCDPVDDYGMSKFLLEEIVKNYFLKLNIILIRPFNIIGIGQSDDFVVQKIVSHFKNKKKVIELGNIEVEREFNDIEYACESLKRLALSEHCCLIVNLASGRTISIKHILEEMQDISGYIIKVKTNQSLIRKDEIWRLSGSSAKLIRLIGTIEQKPLKETLNDMYLYNSNS